MSFRRRSATAIVEVELPEPFPQAHAWHRTINLAEMARNYARYYDKDPSLLSDRLRGQIEEGLTVPRRRLPPRPRRHCHAETPDWRSCSIATTRL